MLSTLGSWKSAIMSGVIPYMCSSRMMSMSLRGPEVSMNDVFVCDAEPFPYCGGEAAWFAGVPVVLEGPAAKTVDFGGSKKSCGENASGLL